MTNLTTFLQDMLNKRARYRRTLAELRRINTDVALDLDLYPGDFPKIARRAAYGA